VSKAAPDFTEHTAGGGGQARAGLGRVAAVVAAHIEPVTRFDASHLAAAGPEEALQAPMTLRLEQRAAFGSKVQAGAARLPAHVEKVPGRAALDAELARELREARADADAAIGAWVQAEPGAYRRLLPAAACFGRAPCAYGYEESCGTCRGCGKVTCSTCHGKGNTECSHCQATGRVRCTGCGGSRSRTCSSCHGRGRWTETAYEGRWDSTRNENAQVQVQVNRSCSACGGDGKTACGSCDWSGKVQCHWCSGQGHERCNPCGATGHVACKPCAASGILHTWGVVEAEVERSETLDVRSTDAVLVAQARDRLDRATLPSLGALTGLDNVVSSATLRSRYELRLDARRAVLAAAGRSFVFYGYGPQTVIVDFAHVAAHLLAADLQALEQAVAAGGRFAVGGGLLEATQRFVESELNLAIAEQVSKAKPAAAAERVERSFKGLVDADYVARSVVALRQAFQRLYGATLLKPLLYLCGAGAVVSGAAFAAAGPVSEAWQIPVTFAVAALLFWFVPEWLARRKLKKSFPAEVSKRVLAQLSATRSPWLWRGGALVVLTLACFGGYLVADRVPWVRHLHAERMAERMLDRDLAAWARLRVPDLKLRPYPDEARLRRAVERGDRRAMPVLAWKLLLGAGGSKVDPEGAARVLQTAGSGVGTANVAGDVLLQAAHAALAAQRPDSAPDELRQAATALARIGPMSETMPEARYWEARIYLDAPAPVANKALGMRKLAEAADRGHARAAFALAESYARGIDVARDPARARRYYTQALQFGMPEAAAALRTLR
jgi:hypothetical protein